MVATDVHLDSYDEILIGKSLHIGTRRFQSRHECRNRRYVVFIVKTECMAVTETSHIQFKRIRDNLGQLPSLKCNTAQLLLKTKVIVR